MAHPSRVSHSHNITKLEGSWLVLALVVVAAIGVAIAPDYGQGTDEYSDFEYASNSLRAYLGSGNFIGPSFQELYGPVHLEVAYLVGEYAVRLPFGWSRTDGRHLANFGAFLLGVAGLYILLRRQLTPMASSVAAILFASQPYLWGHAFINEKDTPFMAYFVVAMALGLMASDRLKWARPERQASSDRGQAIGGQGRTECEGFHSNPPSRMRQILAWTFAGGILLLAVAALGNQLFLPVAKAGLVHAYNGTAWHPVQYFFDKVATDAYRTPVGLYVDKLELVYAWAKIPFTLSWLSLGALVVRRQLPGRWKQLVGRLPRGMLLLAVAGVVLGLADSIRVAAPLAGLLVSGYLLIRHGRQGWLPVAVYGLTALATTYLTWPWLWLSPVGSYLQAIKVMSAFPSHQVLFGGIVYSSRSIPWDYVPRLMGLETTEVVVPLFLVGLVFMFSKSLRDVEVRIELSVVLLWLGVPIALAVGLHSSLYGNLRQMLFILPPLFIVGGYAIEVAFSRLWQLGLRVALGVLILVPSVVGIVELHPYEDSYFNVWVGGTSGAFGQYQVDPWCTSYRQSMDYINAHAPLDAVVDVRGPFQSAVDFARADLRMHPDYKPAPDPDYELLCQIDLLGEGFQVPMPAVYRVTRGRAILSVVRAKP